MSTSTFWAVFFGSSLGTMLINIIAVIIDEYKSNQTHKRLVSLLSQFEYIDEEDWDELVDQIKP